MKHRGHKVGLKGKEWVYSDTKEPVAGNVRPCGHCGLKNTPEGHDGCLGTLPAVMNACCGHGNQNEAYVQFHDHTRIGSQDAQTIIKILKKHKS